MTSETKKDPPRTSDGGQARVTAETVVTDGQAGLSRLRELARRILHVGKRDAHGPEGRAT